MIKLIWHDADGACLFRIGSSGDECTQFVPIVWSLTGHSGSERNSFSGAVLYKYRKLLVPQEGTTLVSPADPSLFEYLHVYQHIRQSTVFPCPTMCATIRVELWDQPWDGWNGAAVG